MRDLCICGKPIMILSSTMRTELDSLDITQVTKFGCLNAKCDKCNQVIRVDEQLHEQ